MVSLHWPTSSIFKILVAVLGLAAFVVYQNVHQPFYGRTPPRVPDSSRPYCRFHTPSSKLVIPGDAELPPDCPPEKDKYSSVVFAKIRKTAGSTLGSIIARYGFERNLTFALPRYANNRFGHTPFEPNMLQTMPDDNGFDFLISHVPFNKSNMKRVMNRDAKYITVLRDPVSHFYSFVEYYELQDSLCFSGDIHSREFCFEDFLSAVKDCNTTICRGIYNGQMFDLGRFGANTETTQDGLEYKIEQIDVEFDLVLIQNYFDESLILLRKLMCWSFTDITYRSKKEYHGTYSSSAQHDNLIKEWNFEDSKLFKHFNRTLWRKIEEYGPSFEEDLTKFREINRITTEQCDDLARHAGIGEDQLRTDCQNLQRDVYDWVKAMRGVIAEAYGLGPDQGRISFQWGPQRQR